MFSQYTDANCLFSLSVYALSPSILSLRMNVRAPCVSSISAYLLLRQFPKLFWAGISYSIA